MSNHHVANTHPESGLKIFKSYVLGFILSIILTYTAYALVTERILANQQLYIALALLALVQLLVQTLCFLRLNTKDPESRWDIVVFLFTILIMVILVSGSLWIMYNLNYYMVA